MRFPKPPEVMPAEVHSLETEVEVYRQTVRHMSATVDSLRVSRASRGTLASSTCRGLLRCPLASNCIGLPNLALIFQEQSPTSPRGAVASTAVCCRDRDLSCHRCMTRRSL